MFDSREAHQLPCPARRVSPPAASLRRRLFYLRWRMFDIDFRSMIITLLCFGALIGGAIVALVLLAWPWLWVMTKPALHAWTT